MKRTPPERLVRLLHLASPTLPVGAYSYSQGIEPAVEAGIVSDTASARRWIGDVLEFSVARMEAPVFLRLHAACCTRDHTGIARWNAFFLATRETAELRAETVQMGYSLGTLLPELGIDPPELAETAFPTAYACAAAAWDIAPHAALVAYLWSWLENQVMAAVRTVPLGQTEAQKLLVTLGERVDTAAAQAARIDDDDLENFVPGLALYSSRHETQYTRLFRS